MKIRHIPPQTFECPNCKRILAYVPSFDFENQLDQLLAEITEKDKEIEKLEGWLKYLWFGFGYLNPYRDFSVETEISCYIKARDGEKRKDGVINSRNSF